MALKPCKSCNHDIDTSAKTCPGCGASEPGITGKQKALGVLVLAAVIVFVLENFGGKSETVTAVEKAPQAVQAVVVKSLDFTPQQYNDRVNAIAGELKRPHQLEDVIYEEGDVNDAYSAKLGPYVSLVGNVSRSTGKLVSVMVLVAGDGTPQSGADIILTASAALAAATPGGDRKAVLNKMSSIANGTPEVFGNVKVSYSEAKGVANWFSASPL